MKEKIEKKEITKKSENFSQWYQDVILKAKLADYAPVRGCMILRPYGYAIWERIQKILDDEFKKAGIENVYFPLFIPERFLKKEKEHVEGFSPQLAVVTTGGGKKLKEKLVVRPTSETIIYEMFSKWIKSWRDLPLKINQWCNVIRWEMRPRLFLRTTEFLWQEAHTVHINEKENIEQVKWALNTYIKLYQDFFSIAGVFGKKSELEKFPGAKETFTYEMLMPDGKALQGCTSHNLGQNFAKAFNINFIDKDGKKKMPFQSCFGLSTRSIGALIMVHGDDQGLILPPHLAPIQVVILPIFKKENNENLIKKAREIKHKLKNLRVKIDLRKEYSIGWKFNEWELKGVPLRVELGEKELKEGKLTLVRRDNFEKISIPMNSVLKKIKEILKFIQRDLFLKSENFLKNHIFEVSNFSEFKEIINEKKGFVKAFWCERPECEIKIKEKTKATTRVLPLNEPLKNGKCVLCQKKAKRKWLFAKAY